MKAKALLLSLVVLLVLVVAGSAEWYDDEGYLGGIWLKEVHNPAFPAPGGMIWMDNISDGVAIRAQSDHGVGLEAVSDSSGLALRAQGTSYFDGNVGIGTSDPGAPLEIVGSENPRLRATKEGTERRTIVGYNTTFEEGYLSAVDSGTGYLPLTSQASQHQIYIGNSEKVRIDQYGNVGIGKLNPECRLDIIGVDNDGSNATLRIQDNDSGFMLLDANEIDAMGETPLHLNYNSPTDINLVTGGGNVAVGHVYPPTERLHVDGNVLANDYLYVSSFESKDQIELLPADQAISVLRDLEPVTFKLKTDWDENHVGFIAEDVPELVSTRDRKSLSPMDIVAVLTRVVQEQQNRIEELEARYKMGEYN